MKAEELMIGDWVEVIDSDHLKYVKVRNILDISIVTEAGEYESEVINLDNIKPITLTFEMLELNRRRDFGSFRDFFSLYLDNYGAHIIKFMDYIDIRYVHELQHALKLCGIEKEIQL